MARKVKPIELSRYDFRFRVWLPRVGDKQELLANVWWHDFEDASTRGFLVEDWLIDTIAAADLHMLCDVSPDKAWQILGEATVRELSYGPTHYEEVLTVRKVRVQELPTLAVEPPPATVTAAREQELRAAARIHKQPTRERSHPGGRKLKRNKRKNGGR